MVVSERRLRELAGSPVEVAAALAAGAEMWGALWQPGSSGGDLVLPVVQGLRRGVVHARIELTPATFGCQLDLAIAGRDLHLNRTAVLILILGGLGGMSVVLWPLSPWILQLAPVGVVLAIAAWLMVVSRLRTSGVDDFLDLIASLIANKAASSTPG